MQYDIPNHWYLFVCGVALPKRWEGEEIDQTRVSSEEKEQIEKLLNSYRSLLSQEIRQQGSYEFNPFWCNLGYGGSGGGAFLLPKSEKNLHFLVKKKAQLEDLRATCGGLFPTEFEAVEAVFDILRPIGYMLPMEANIVYLPGQEEEIMREVAEYFKDVRSEEYWRIIASKKFGWLKEDMDVEMGKSQLEWIRRREELAFRAREAKYQEIFDLVERDTRAEAIQKLRALRRANWYDVEPGVSEEAEQDDPKRWYVITGRLKTRGEEPIWCGLDSLNITPEWDNILEEEGYRVLRLLNLAEPPRLVSVLEHVVPELSVGAWFDPETITEKGKIGPNRDGVHMNRFWCGGTAFEYSNGVVSIMPSLGAPGSIKGPYMIPKRKGALRFLSEKRRLLKERVQAKAHELKLDELGVKPLVLIFEVKSPWLGQPDDKGTAMISEWFTRAREICREVT